MKLNRRGPCAVDEKVCTVCRANSERSLLARRERQRFRDTVSSQLDEDERIGISYSVHERSPLVLKAFA